MMGVDEKDQEATVKTLSSTSNMLDIYRGLEVGGVSIGRLTRSIAKTRTELGDLLKGLESGDIQALAFEGDLGTLVREKAYRSLGFSKLKGDEFPHHGSRGLMPGYKELGAGRVVLVQSMRSDLAREGLQARLTGEWNLVETRLLDKVKAVEDAAISSGRSLNDVLEGEALAARATKTGAAFDAPDQTRTGRIGTADAHIKALRDQIAFLKSLEDAGIKTPVARSTLEANLAAAAATRGDLVLNEAGLQGSTTLHTYQPGPEAKTLLEARYGAGKVGDPDANGIIKVEIGGAMHVFVPAPEGAVAGAATAKVGEGGGVRVVAPGVVALEPKAMRGAKARVEGTGGTWTDAGNGIAVATVGGDTVLVISEGRCGSCPSLRPPRWPPGAVSLPCAHSSAAISPARASTRGWRRTGRGEATATCWRISRGSRTPKRAGHAMPEACTLSWKPRGPRPYRPGPAPSWSS
jgi:hypothetical protein